MNDYLIFGDVDSRDYGVYIFPTEIDDAPKRAYKRQEIAGRSGDLLIDQKRFENIQMHYYGYISGNDYEESLRDFRAALMSQIGYQRLEDSIHSDEYYDACYIDTLVVKTALGRKLGRFEIVFNRKPQRWLKSGEEVIVVGEWGETETVSGGIATFEADEKTKIKSVVGHINPVQDLHGYDNPWPAGGGKNLFDKDAASTGYRIGTNGIASEAEGYYTSDYIPVVVGSSYTKNSPTADAYHRFAVYDASKSFVRIAQNSAQTVTIESGEAYIRFCGLQTELNSAQLELGSTSTSYAPYSNICPISGFTGMNITGTGKNLFNIGLVPNTIVIGTNYNFYIKAKPNTQYTISSNLPNGITDGNAQVLAGPTNVSLSTANHGAYPGKTSTFTTGSDGIIRVLCRRTQNAGITSDEWLACWIQVEEGNVATPYEPFGTVYPVAFPSEAGTVYGGYVDVTNGKLTLTNACVSLKRTTGGSISKSVITTEDIFLWTNTNYIIDADTKLSHFNFVNSSTTQEIGKAWIGSSQNQLRIGYSAYDTTDLTTFLSWLDNVDMQVYCKLATPIVYDLTPIQIATLLGINHIWHDCNGDTDVEYGDNPNIIFNPTKFESNPLLRVYGTGKMYLGDYDITVSANDDYTDIDCFLMEAYKGIVSKNANVSFGSSSKPALVSGDNTIDPDTMTRVEVTPRWYTI